MTGRADWRWLIGRYFQHGAWRGADYARCRRSLNTPEELTSPIREDIADHKHVAAKIGIVPQ